MAFQTMTTNDLERILAAGASIEIETKARMVDDWVRLAAAAKRGGSVLTLRVTQVFMTDQLVRIATAGAPGHVSFKD